MKLNITPEVIEALVFLRNSWNGGQSLEAIDAFDALDNSGVFHLIDKASRNEIDVRGSRTLIERRPAPDWAGDK